MSENKIHEQIAHAAGWRACSKYEYETQSNMRIRGIGSYFINIGRDASFCCELFGDDAWKCLCETTNIKVK